MSDPTKRDVRSEVSVEAHAALLAEQHATGVSISAQIAGLVEVWAQQRIHAATVLHGLLRSNESISAPTGKRGLHD